MDHYGNPNGGWNGSMHPDEANSNSNSASPHPNQQPMMQVCADVKPRLTKEQHDILECHFRQQPKPSTTVKKGFAEALGVPLDKINVGFCRRRVLFVRRWCSD